MNHWNEIQMAARDRHANDLRNATLARHLRDARSDRPAQSWLSKLLRRAPRQAPAEIVEAISDIPVAEAPAKA